MGIVKANAYGHGLVETAGILVGEGIDYLGVGFLQEGIMLRRSGIRTPVLVLGGVLGDQIQAFLENDLEITVSSIELARRIENEVSISGARKARVHLKIDTGMERIGVRAENALPFAQEVAQLPHLEILGIYSHLATSDESDKSFASKQVRKFNEVARTLESHAIGIPLKHIANSGAILDMPDSYFNLARPGIMLYGLYPSRDTSESIPLHPVLSLRSKVVFIKEVAAHTSISYGRTYYTQCATRIATIPIGYGDGYSRMLSGRAHVLIRGERYPVVGTICMDQMMVDIGTQAEIHVGDDVTLIGKDGRESISAWDLAEQTGTNHYEVLCMIAARVPRVCVECPLG
jgi:alanine racemase